MADSLAFNKVAGAVLATGLVIFGLQNLTSILFEREPPAKPGYAIAIQEETGGGAAADVIPDWGAALPAGNIAHGQQLTQKCASCHMFDASGANNIGPGLFGVVGRAPGTHAGYAYDQAMQDFHKTHPVWTYDLLYQFLKNPQGFMPGTKMTFVGLPNPQDRIDVIDYLRSDGSSNVPIPPPQPKAAPSNAAASNAVASNTAASNSASNAAAAAAAPAANQATAAK